MKQKLATEMREIPDVATENSITEAAGVFFGGKDTLTVV